MRDPREIMRDEMLVRDRLLEVMQDGPSTVPEIARALNRPSHEVMHWVMAARKYGAVEEVPGSDDDGYFRYIPTPKE
jgi:hypothetical protein